MKPLASLPASLGMLFTAVSLHAQTVPYYPVPPGSGPHDVAPAPGGAWYTAQRSGALGWLVPATGRTEHIPLGCGPAPHGVIVGADGAEPGTDRLVVVLAK